MKKSLLILPFVLLAAALALSACGGGGSISSGSGDEAEIEAAIQKSATSNDPTRCTEYETVAFSEQQTNLSGKKATEQCEAEAEENEEPAKSVDVSNISVEGETATAEAALNGSALDGQTVELELANEGGAWKLNQFITFTKYDGGHLAEELEKGLEANGEVEPTTIKCLAEGVAEMSQEEAEEITFEGNLELLEELGCE